MHRSTLVDPICWIDISFSLEDFWLEERDSSLEGSVLGRLKPFLLSVITQDGWCFIQKLEIVHLKTKTLGS